MAPDRLEACVEGQAGDPPGLRAVDLLHPDGTGVRRVLEPGVAEKRLVGIGPRLSPDGRSVAFVHAVWEGDARRASIEVIGVDGEGRRTLLKPDGPEVPFAAIWSPDGNELAVWLQEDRNRPGEPRRISNTSNICEIVGADGKNRRRLPILDGVRFIVDDWR
jgi:hypothetical protein